MLSRVANCLYWMSRYIERADNTARIVDVNLQLLLDFRKLDDQSLAEHWMPIIESTGDEEKFLSQKPRGRASRSSWFLTPKIQTPSSAPSARRARMRGWFAIRLPWSFGWN